MLDHKCTLEKSTNEEEVRISFLTVLLRWRVIAVGINSLLSLNKVVIATEPNRKAILSNECLHIFTSAVTGDC